MFVGLWIKSFRRGFFSFFTKCKSKLGEFPGFPLLCDGFMSNSYPHWRDSLWGSVYLGSLIRFLIHLVPGLYLLFPENSMQKLKWNPKVSRGAAEILRTIASLGVTFLLGFQFSMSFEDLQILCFLYEFNNMLKIFSLYCIQHFNSFSQWLSFSVSCLSC